MPHILELFGRSPFALLQDHMGKVSECIHCLEPFFQALISGNEKKQNSIADEISRLEHQADITKNEIRNHLPTSMFLSIDRATFLEMLALQDSIADSAEDISVLITLRPMKLLKTFEEPFLKFLAKNIECFEKAHLIIQEQRALIESSFGGIEAEKVKKMCDEVAYLEHLADVLQREVLTSLYKAEPEISYGVYDQWQKVFTTTGSISNLAEKLANCVRMTLEVT
jgi:predicted phosphate transport protein (TIGR00153 family)